MNDKINCLGQQN